MSGLTQNKSKVYKHAYKTLYNLFFVIVPSSSTLSSALYQPWLPASTELHPDFLLTRRPHPKQASWSYPLMFNAQVSLYQQTLPNCVVKTMSPYFMFSDARHTAHWIVHVFYDLISCLFYLQVSLEAELGLSPIALNTTLTQSLRIEIMELFLLSLIIHIKYSITFVELKSPKYLHCPLMSLLLTSASFHAAIYIMNRNYNNNNKQTLKHKSFIVCLVFPLFLNLSLHINQMGPFTA